MPALVVPLTIALLGGIACSGPWPRAHALATMLLLAGGACLALGAASHRRWIALGAAGLVAFAGGWRLGLRAHDRALDRPLRHLLAPALAEAGGDTVWLEGRLLEDAGRGSAGVVLLLDVQRARGTGEWSATRGAVRLGLYGEVSDGLLAQWRRGRCVRAPAVLRVPSSFRNPGGTDADLDLARRGIALVGSIKSAALVDACGPGTVPQEWAGRVRDGVRAAITRHVASHDPQSAAIVLAIVLGDRAAVDDGVEERLRRAGTYHVIAISGGNIAVLTGMLVWAVAWTRAPPRATAALAMAGLAAYAWLVVRGASVDRAVLVALVYLAARMADVRAHPLALLATTAAALLLWNPLVAFDVGFALTFGATAGLVVVAPPLIAWAGQRLPASTGASLARAAAVAALALLAGTVAAELAVVPISATAFGRVTFAGLLLNFAAVPLMALVQLAGLATVALAGAAPPLADLNGWVAHLAVRGIVDSAALADWWPWLQRRTPPPALGLLALHVAALAVASAAATPARARRLALACACGTTIGMAGGWWPARAAGFGHRAAAEAGLPSALRVTVLDVGQGDAVVVQFPSSRVMVVDTGGLAASPRFDIGRRVVSPALHALGVREITWLVLTHGDPDHVGGAAALIDDWRPREVWEGVPVARQGALRALRALAGRHGAAWRRVRDGDVLSVGEVDVLVRHPPPPDWERQRVRNDDSIVLELRYGATSIVLPGDIGAAVERRLAAAPWAPRLRVLKAAHHGSAGSSEATWLAALAPAAAVFSAGRGNPFGHPSGAALARVRAAGADTFRTDEDGAVRVVTDGHRLVIETMGGRRWLRTAG